MKLVVAPIWCNSTRPVRKVNMAPQRNHQSARGASFLSASALASASAPVEVACAVGLLPAVWAFASAERPLRLLVVGGLAEVLPGTHRLYFYEYTCDCRAPTLQCCTGVRTTPFKNMQTESYLLRLHMATNEIDETNKRLPNILVNRRSMS